MGSTKDEAALMMLNTSSSAPKSSSRSVDEYYNIAYDQGTNRWHFWLIFLSLGIANSGDATEITCMNYILSHPLFKEEILQSDNAGRRLWTERCSDCLIDIW